MLQESFDSDWRLGYVKTDTWTPQASDDSVLAWKLLVQTGVAATSTDSNRIGCLDTKKKCEKVSICRGDVITRLPRWPLCRGYFYGFSVL